MPEPAQTAHHGRERRLLLLGRKANVNARQRNGSTALPIGAFLGRRDVVELLLESGADAAVKMDDGRTAEMLARAKGHRELAELLARQDG